MEVLLGEHPKLVFDTDLLDDDSGDEELDKYMLANTIFHVLLLRRAPILEFTLIVDIDLDIFREVDQIILHLSIRNNIKKFILGFLGGCSYDLSPSFFSLRGLEHIDLTSCIIELPSTYKGFSMLKSLHLTDVDITNKMLFKFLTNCPLLEEFTWIRGDETDVELTVYEFVRLFRCLPSVQVLKISKVYTMCIKHLVAGNLPHKLPFSLVNLRTLDLSVCFLELPTVLRVIRSSPNLEKIKLEMYREEQDPPHQTVENLSDDQDYTSLNLDHLKEVEITNFHDYAYWKEFVKFIMANSPVLKKARIELDEYVSADEENKMLGDLLHMSFPIASPEASFIIER